jgi:adenylate cyclase
VVPSEIADTDSVREADLIAVAIYLPAALIVGVIWGNRRAATVRAFLREERPPTPEERRGVLRAPLGVAKISGVLWGGAVVLFAVLNLTFSLEAAYNVAVTVALGGITTCAIAYLLSERLLRPTAVRALASATPEGAGVPGVAARSVLFWALGTGVPLVGLLLVALGVLSGEDKISEQQLATIVVVFAGLALVIGLGVGVLASRATADPIISVRDALAEVERGELDVEVPVYDGSEVGQLQAGFNRMVAGLREREKIRETFGTYVDRDVAEHILSEEGAEGQEVEVTLMFLDVRDFTGFAERAAPREVVSTLNRLFESAVPIVRRHGGHVDKFIGDGFLAVFGAPRPASDHADQALAAALEIARVVDGMEDQRLQIGIGLNTGSVVAGSIGGAGRLEFSVIGDAVNVAARVEAATRETGDVILLSERTRELLHGEYELVERPGIELKGKSAPATLYAPRSPRGGAR